MDTPMDDDAAEPSPAFFTTEEVAELFRTSPETIRAWRSSGYGPPAVRIGRRALYRADALWAWVELQEIDRSRA